MRIRSCFDGNEPAFSFEFFPPKSPEAVEALYHTAAELARLDPCFVSVTYGAGGSTREMTVELVARINRELGVEAMAHLTCVGHTADEIACTLDRLWELGIRNVLALRGDPSKGQEQFCRPEGGFAYAQELVRFIRSRWDFCVGGAAYPEGHMECPDRDLDLLRLKQKADSGVEFLITQLFFDPDDYFGFVDRARAIGIEVPIVPGIMPVHSVPAIERFTARSGSRIPDALRARMEPARGNDEEAVKIGIEWATEECRALLDGGAPGIHFYTLNRSQSVHQVHANLTGKAVPCLI